jgi:hypothetical protein
MPFAKPTMVELLGIGVQVVLAETDGFVGEMRVILH